MPLIKANGRIMQDGTKMIQYTDTVGPSYVTYTLENEQESVVISNKGVKPIVFSVGTTTITINPGENQRLEINFTSFQVKSVAGIQQFEVLMDEVGSTLPGGSDPLLSQKVNDITSQLAQTMQQPSAAQSVLQKLYHNISDVNIVVLGDSTGNETWEWVYLLAQKLGESYPTHTVKYYLWDSATLNYPASPITVKSGAGTQSLNIWNASVPGMYSYYPIQHEFNKQVLVPNPDLVIISHSHNEASILVDADKWTTKARLYLLTQYVSAKVPDASIMLIAQNPATANEYQKQRAHMIAEISMKCGYGFVNVHDAFLAINDWQNTLMGDTVHPNEAGQKVWIDEVMKHFKYVPNFRPVPQIQSSFSEPVKNLITNGDFSLFSTATPDNWVAQGTPTLSKDTTNFETGSHGLKMISAAGVSGMVYQDVHALSGLNINFFKGKVVTLAVRLRKPTGQVTTAGRIAINDGVSTVSSRASFSGDGNFYWDVVSMRISETPSRIRIYLYADSATGGNVEVTVDRAILCTGLLPKDMY